MNFIISVKQLEFQSGFLALPLTLNPGQALSVAVLAPQQA